MGQEAFTGFEKAVILKLAQTCRLEEIYGGQLIVGTGQKLQDLLILREGRAQQENLPDAQGRTTTESPRHVKLHSA